MEVYAVNSVQKTIYTLVNTLLVIFKLLFTVGNSNIQFITACKCSQIWEERREGNHKANILISLLK